MWEKLKKRYKGAHRAVALVLVCALLLSGCGSIQTAYAYDGKKDSGGGFEQHLSDSSEQFGYIDGDASGDIIQGTFYPADFAGTPVPSAQAYAQDKPELVYDTTLAAGRDYTGQQTIDINGKIYILIGSQAQLVALDTYNRGSDNELTAYSVTGPVWKMTYAREKNYGSWSLSSAELVYPGDADLIDNLNTNSYTYDKDGNKTTQSQAYNFANQPIYSIAGYLTESEELYEQTLGEATQPVKTQKRELGKTYFDGSIAGLQRKKVSYVGGTLEEPNLDINKYSEGSYTKSNNYILFRDIAMAVDGEKYAWTPLMFSGTIIGVKAPQGKNISDVIPCADYNTVGRPAISNVDVTQTGKLRVDNYSGVGFFATIADEFDANSIGINTKGAKVENIELKNISVVNHSTETEMDQTLVNGLLSGTGWIVGSIADILAFLLTLGNDLKLRDILSDLLDAKKDDPTAFATGGFAGRTVGNVEIRSCAVTNVTVSNVKDYTGGFVGYSEGVTQYEGLSKTLGGLANLLSSLLNIIPGIGLGDLITILLENALPIGNLIPTGYINPAITGCTVEKLSGTVGMENTSFVGGFIGRQTAVRMTGCQVKNSTYTVAAQQYGGGFSGVARDADIKGLLQDLGVELIRVAQPQSLLVECAILDSHVTITGVNYLGGFAGVMANSYAVNCGINGGVLNVNASGSYAGGFAGRSTMGWLTSVGKDEAKSDSSLLTTVKELLIGLLGDKNQQDKAQALLTLVGLTPSVIVGCSINCESIEVSATGSYAGGFVGEGDAVVLGQSSAENLQEIPYWKYAQNGEAYPISELSCILSGLTCVSAKNYAGGVIGFAGTANVAGLLNGTLGVGDFKSFKLDDIQVSGVEDGYTVQAENGYAGGAVGMGIGGDIYKVKTANLKSVLAINYAAGFIGCSYPGDIAGSDGLSLSLLGLDILSLKNLLSVGAAIQVKISDCNVYGIEHGYTVTAFGSDNSDVAKYMAGGFIAQANSMEIRNSHVYNLNFVTAPDEKGYAGGYLGVSRSGSLADVAGDAESLLKILEVNGLLSAVQYMIPKYENCTVHYINEAYAKADVAGGFAADFQSGTVDNIFRGENDYYAVYDISKVVGRTYAGGFGGKLHSGAIADAGKGLSLLGGTEGSLLDLKISASDLLSVAQVYVPSIKYAGVKSGTVSGKGILKGGFTVSATGSGEGKAGGFAGYTSGAQISYCDVSHLANTQVTPPKELEGVDGSSYFGPESAYSVTGELYAGGYVGDMNIGSAASVGEDLKLLGTAIELTNVADVLSAVVSTIEHSDVTGAAGGFSVLASYGYRANPAGTAGGFAGRISGGHVQDSNSYSFSYITGQIAAGGYVGQLESGNVANVLGNDSSILGGLVDTSEALASIAEDFVPTIRNSETTCIPCGGAVRADARSDAAVQRGMAGGYCGHNESGQIWGNNKNAWKEENTGEIIGGIEYKTRGEYTGIIRPCAAVRILSVYGAEYAGGFTGLMECADTASAGNLSLLFGLVEVSNLLGALSIVYPTEENTEVWGPLAKITLTDWNNWLDSVGKKGGFGKELAQLGEIASEDELYEKLSNYVYGTHVAAGRTVYDSSVIVADGGCAGGYVGAMHSGVITNGQAHDTKQITAMRAAGGFAGEMVSGGAADLGSVRILDLNLNLGQTVDVLQLFVPTIQVSSVGGYRDGMTIYADGKESRTCGYAGGYVGSAMGAQIWGDKQATETGYVGCNVKNLRRVGGTNAIGGYVGRATAGSVANADTSETSSGLLQGVLDYLISTPGDLVSALQATVTTLRCASVDADSDWGFVVEGEYQTGKYANYAGGFAGWLEATVIGELDNTEKMQTVSRLRGVDAAYYAGGFFGLADTGSVAEVGGGNGEGSGTTILNLIQAGNVGVLNAFRSYIYSANVRGTCDGIRIYAHKWAATGEMKTYTVSGAAGGFGGGLMNGTVHDAKVADLSYIEAPNYAAGFIGYMGKGGGVDVDAIKVKDDSMLGNLLTALGLDLNLNAQALNVFGSTVKNAKASGFRSGFIARATNTQVASSDTAAKEYLTGSIAAGFAGYADVSQINNCHVTNLKKVISPQVAAGFVGSAAMSYLVDAGASAALVELVLKVVDVAVKGLYLGKLEDSNLLDLTLIPGFLEIKLFSDGNTAYINLLGLKISVALSKEDPEYEDKSDAVIITIGDSAIKLPCDKNGIKRNEEGEYPELELTLIKGNRTNITGSSVSGIIQGYDVFGGDADDTKDGMDEFGYAGGFIGYNDEGNLENNRMWLCDIVRGAPEKVGPFAGVSSLKTVNPLLNSLEKLEGNNNYFGVYRTRNDTLKNTVTVGGVEFSDQAVADKVTGCNRYDVLHYAVVKQFEGYMDAKESGGGYTRDLLLYASAAKAVLMLDKVNSDNAPGLTPEPAQGQNPCAPDIDFTIQKKWKDWNNAEGIRPDGITVTIYRSYERLAEDGAVLESRENDPVMTIPMTYADHGSKWSSAWETSVKLPVGYADPATGEILYYYTYTVEEAPVDGYVTAIEYDETGYVATITNQHDPELPLTGAAGSFVIVLAGAVLICIGCEWLLRKKRKSGEVKK